MNNKHLAILLAALGVILLSLILSLVPVIDSVSESDCVCGIEEGGSCPHDHSIPIQIYLGSGAVLIMFYISYTLFVKELPKKIKVNIPEDLSKEEKQVMEDLVKAKGMIFQSELVEKLGVSKVKVTRILDRLEGRNLIERRRRGMTNAVILKQDKD
jgi:uncharacterized membrane protein